MKMKPVAYIDCPEAIPCDPCVAACPKGAITMDGGLTGLPRLDPKKCDGCGACVAVCPGLAIRLVALGDADATVGLPWEFLPLPEKGAGAVLLDASGREVGRGHILRVQNPKKHDRTAIVTVSAPKAAAQRVRHLRPVEGEGR